MTQYLLSNLTPTGHTLEPARLQEVIAEVTALTLRMQEAGVWVFAMPLGDPAAAQVVSQDQGAVTLADGPFAELKEYVGGLTVIDVPTAAEAADWAAQVAAATGLRIEVRPGLGFGA